MPSKIHKRRFVGAICPECKSPDYRYGGLAKGNNKHTFICNSCKNTWTYGTQKSIYTKNV